MEFNDILRKYVLKIDQGEIEFSALRSELQKNHLLSEEETTVMVRLVDKKVQELAVSRSEKAKGRNEFILGAIALFIGLVITLGTFFNIFGSGNFYIVTFGLLGYGSITMFNGKRKMKA